MTIYGQPLHRDSENIITSSRYGAVGDGSDQWYGIEKILNGDNVTQGAIADAAVTDPAASGTVVALLKGLLTNLRSTALGLMKLEDTAHTSGDAGVMGLAVRMDTGSTLAGTDGDYTPLQVDAVGSLRVVLPAPAAAEVILNATTTAYAASLVVKATAGKLLGFQGYNSLATAQFIQVYDSATLPADAAVPEVVIVVPGKSNFSISFGVGRLFATGIVIGNSATGPTKTIGAADCWIDAQYV